MRLKATRLFAVAALSLTTRAAAAQLPLSFAIGGGASFPTSGLGDRTDAGYNVLASLGLHIPVVPISVRFDGMFNQFKYNSATGPNGGLPYRTVTANADVWAGSANAVLTSSGLLAPYLIAGVGAYRTSEADLRALEKRSATSFGGNVGGGLRLGLAGFGIFAEARYHWISDSDVRIVPVTIGVSF